MNKKATSIVGYITIIGWLIAFLAGDKEGAKFHLNQGLVLAIVTIGNNIISMVLSKIPIVGFVIALVCGIISILCFVFMIVGIINAATDKEKQLPLIGGFQVLK